METSGCFCPQDRAEEAVLPRAQHPVTFLQVISKPRLFLFKPGGSGDLEILGTTSVEGLKTTLWS